MLIRRDDRGLGFERVYQRLAVRIEQRFHGAALRHFDNFAIEVRRYAGRDAAADHQPVRALEPGLHQAADFGKLARIERRTHFVELHREPLLVRDGQVDAALGLDVHRFERQADGRERFLHAGAGVATGGEKRERLAPKGMDHLRSVDAPAARGLTAAENVGAIFKHQLVNGYGSIDGGIDSESDDQWTCPESGLPYFYKPYSYNMVT
jgi:hypothetical protein